MRYLFQHSRSLFFTAIVLVIVGGGLLLLSGSLSVVVAQSQMTMEETSDLMRNQFGSNPGRTSNTTLLIISGCVLAGIIISLILFERFFPNRGAKNGYYSPGRLFRELCQAHEFTKHQQTILKNIAKELQIKNLGVLFIEPKHLELAMSEPIVRDPLESIREIYRELFSANTAPSDVSKEDKDNTWFAWTKVRDNPEASQLRRELEKEWTDELLDSQSSTNLPQTQKWDSSLWNDIQQAVPGANHEKNESQSHSSQIPPYQMPPLQEEPDQTVREKTVYKPRYPEAQDALVHQDAVGQVSSNHGDAQTPSQKTPPSAGAQILSSMLYSVSDVTSELAYSSIRNHLTRSVSLSPQSLGEITQKKYDEIPDSQAISLDDMMISPQKSLRQRETQTQVETRAVPKVAIKQIELKRTEIGGLD